MSYNSIRPGQVWNDTNGKRIQAHGFSVIYDENDDLYYWYGENKEFTIGKGTVWHWGVRCYSSRDLYNWEDRGLIIPPQPEDLTSPLHPTYHMDRPHILFCPNTGKYVAWLKIMCGMTSQFMSVLQADSFLGPYEFVHKVYKPLQMDTGDFDLQIDPETGKAYFIFDRPHFEIVTATLDDSYTSVTGEYSEHYQGLLPPVSREAPACFRKDKRWYMFTSSTTGKWSNPSQVCTFEHFHDDYVDLGDPCSEDKSGTTYNSQITSVIKIPGKDLYIACADRWRPGKSSVWKSRLFYRFVKLSAKNPGYRKFVHADTTPKLPQPLPEKEIMNRDNCWCSDYVWLPIEWADGKPILRWKDEWRIEDYV